MLAHCNFCNIFLKILICHGSSKALNNKHNRKKKGNYGRN
jgi:hypothetical protein